MRFYRAPHIQGVSRGSLVRHMQSKNSDRRRTRVSVFQSRPSIAFRRTTWAGDYCVGTVIRTGFLLQVEILHPTSGKSYARMCRSLQEFKAAENDAELLCLALGMEIQEVEA